MTFAFWCVLIAALLPYAPLAFSTSHVDQRLPRKSVANLEGTPARAYGAHLNALEAFPFFAAAVIISHVVIGASTTVNWLAAIFILLRLAHMAFYITDRAPFRTAVWGAGMLIDIIIFVHAAWV